MADEAKVKLENASPTSTSISKSPSPSPVKKTETELDPAPISSESGSILPTTAPAEQQNSPSSSSTVTSSSPTESAPVFNSQAYQQQLHEAMMAFDSHGMSQNLMAAAAAAMAAAVGVSSSSTPGSPAPHLALQQQQSQPLQQHRQQNAPRVEMDPAKRESIRAANRERKKKWRIHNEERNKDNDLRCRVNKRASKLFGQEQTEAKRLWAIEEFSKRREKRQEKERRKDVVNNVLSVQQQQQQQQQQQLQQQQQQAADDLAQSFAAYPSVFDASKILEIPSDLQRHLLEQLNLALTNSKLPAVPIDYAQSTSETIAEASTDQHPSADTNHQTNTDTPTISSSSSTAAEAAAAAAELLAAATTATTIPEQQPAATSSSAQSSPTSPTTPIKMDIDEPSSSAPPKVASDGKDEDNTNGSDTDKDSLSSKKDNEGSSNAPGEEEDRSNKIKKQEYPMDAVLTLMQLGWKK